MDDLKETNPHESSLPGVLGVIDSTISRVESVLLAAGVLLMAFNTIANVVGRFVFQYSLFFSEELNRILIILITFAGISYAARQGRHIRMSAIYDALPPPARKGFMVLIAAVTAVTMFALCYFSIGYITKVAVSGRVLPSLQLPIRAHCGQEPDRKRHLSVDPRARGLRRRRTRDLREDDPWH